MDLSIVYQDHDILVISKPAGVVMNKADTTRAVITVQDMLESMSEALGYSKEDLAYKSKDELPEGEYDYKAEFAARCGIVHRLDKDTSGVLVIAKNPESFLYLKNQFKNRETKKIYTALVHGKIRQNRGEIDAPIARLPWNRTRFGIVPNGRNATTQFTVTSYFTDKNESYTLVSCFPLTGRTHQIRVHMQYIHHPIVSDELYAGRKTYRSDKLFCPRMFLHATSLAFKHPKTHEVVTFTADLPADLLTALNSLTRLALE